MIRSAYSFAKDIKISHSIFALPFVLSVFFLIQITDFSVINLFFIILCMVTARSYAMGMNRYIDRKIDEKNPRTAHRALPLKQLSNRSYLGWCVLFAVGFLLSSMTFGAHIGVLAFFVLIILGLYPF